MENMNLSHDIEEYILGLLSGEEDFISLRRKELAEMFECVPSQINYVLRSRFTPEQGYLIESRRGEHGYIKILKVTCEKSSEKVSHINDIIGDEISLKEAKRILSALQSRRMITGRERLIIEVALRHITDSKRDADGGEIADLLKNMLCGLMGA
ncbi:MAG: CtsR family transcriptional regulator [Synergistaceae bacterium]|nr:CtsR family transcriptional regulator [Synergistaceae bacterium]MBQ3345474.1 CtsR family transcriptional regulator [Synergistaceae bacterium]MBQ3398358.1 CtsR family transcriptional regulator [Synergistaceae bacterium]MBQ3757959.1 CtsR family transcriptional regulator [Synergistaceae bacterium]MBQ4401854.1 CtsR family transcriptional regulator [Synergistaceae bacterium]